MPNSSNSVNAGIHAQNGFALQRNTALFILLEEFHTKFKDNKYFISIEHHDDFLFCFLDKNDSADSIKAYQSKKRRTEWTINKEFAEILSKLLNTGSLLIKDAMPKTTLYTHDLHFISNSPITLKKSKSQHNVSVNEENCHVPFTSLNLEIQKEIKTKFEPILSPQQEAELMNLHFSYVVFSSTDKEQRNQLVGKLEEVFQENISNYRAAINTLIALFRDIETIYNQGGQARLLDKSKRVTSDNIDNTIKILTTQAKAFNYWRQEAKIITATLDIKPWEKDDFILCFESAFDFFKSIIESEHQKILQYVSNNYRNCQTSQEEENVLELFNMYKMNLSTHFDDLTLKAIIYAAYFESINKKES